MNTLTLLSHSPHTTFHSSTVSPNKTGSFLQPLSCSSALGFCFPKPLFPPAKIASRVRISYKFRRSLFPAEPQLSDVDEEDDDEDDDDDDVAADEYDDVPGEASDGVEDEIETSMAASEVPAFRSEESKWQRVEKLCNEFREFGEELIDVDELASIYDFRIDKFQVYFSVLSKICMVSQLACE